MIKAETLITTRRAILADAPAAAAAALAGGMVANALAIAEAKAADVEPEPVVVLQRGAMALAQVTQATQPAPVYAAIKAERGAFSGYCATGEVQSRIEADDPCPLKILEGRAPSARSIAKRLAHPAFKVWQARHKEAEDAHTESAQELWAAREAFLQTQPTSLAGLRAYLDHIEGPYSHGDAGEAFWDENEMELAFRH
jgi:hypothetical protein